MREMIAIVMACTGLDSKEAVKRLEAALDSLETCPEYAEHVEGLEAARRPPAIPPVEVKP